MGPTCQVLGEMSWSAGKLLKCQVFSFLDAHHIPFDGEWLLGVSWSFVSSRPWRFSENITVLEGRAAVAALGFIFGTAEHRQQTHLLIVDSMALALTFEKGISYAPGLRSVCRRVAALLLCAGAAA